MKKIALFIVLAIVLNFVMTISLQSEIAMAANEKLSDMTFSVGDNLSLGDDQKMAYFDEGTTASPNKEGPIVQFALSLIELATKVIGSIAVILIIVTGFLFMTSRGNQQKLDEAKDVLIYTLIGLAVTFLSYIITIFVQSLFTA